MGAEFEWEQQPGKILFKQQSALSHHVKVLEPVVGAVGAGAPAYEVVHDDVRVVPQAAFSGSVAADWFGKLMGGKSCVCLPIM